MTYFDSNDELSKWEATNLDEINKAYSEAHGHNFIKLCEDDQFIIDSICCDDEELKTSLLNINSLRNNYNSLLIEWCQTLLDSAIKEGEPRNSQIIGCAIVYLTHCYNITGILYIIKPIILYIKKINELGIHVSGNTRIMRLICICLCGTDSTVYTIEFINTIEFMTINELELLSNLLADRYAECE